MTSRRQITLAVALVLGATAATVLLSGGDRPAAEAGGHDHAAMTADGDGRPVRLSDAMKGRIGVTYADAVARRMTREVRAVGTVTYDERRLVSLNPKVEGWVEELVVDFTGAEVRRGQPMLRIYSPALVAAQEELLLARRLFDRTREAPDSRAASNAADLVEAARRRLAYWDVPEDEVRRVEETGAPRKGLLLRAPASGIVVEKHAQVGGRVMPGTPLYRIADLSSVWVEAEVFEKDLSLVRRGQEATVSMEAYPGESFTGRVTYVYPVVSVETRTARVRLELPNPDARLKPGMYATVRLTAPASAPVVTVPRGAVLNTGERTLVFVRDGAGALLSRAVRTGLASGDLVPILEGLEAGETVVASAAFLIDAESSLGAATRAMGAAPASSAAPVPVSGAAAAAPATGVPAAAPASGAPAGATHTGHGGR